MTVPMGNNSAKRYTYYYDKEGRQVGMDVEAVSVTSSPTLTAGSSGSNTRFFYDNSRNRVKLITKSGSAYYFVYDPTASIPAVVYEAAGNTAYMNVREPSGALISREKYTGGVYQYSRTYHFDGLGSTIALTDEDGVTTDTYSYDAWGNATHTSGTIADNPYQYVGEFGYYTHYQEPTLNLLQLGVRYYDPSVGRFTQVDPIRDGVNWYGYVNGNFIGVTDPKGLYVVIDDFDCPVLADAVNRVVDVIRNPSTECITAMIEAGVAETMMGFVLKRPDDEFLYGFTFKCCPNYRGAIGHPQGASAIIDASSTTGTIYLQWNAATVEQMAALIIHEITHHADLKGRTDPYVGWTCPTCGISMPSCREAREERAESVMHKCFPGVKL